MSKFKELLEPFKKQKERNFRIFLSWVEYIIISLPIAILISDGLDTGLKWKVCIGLIGFVFEVIHLFIHEKLINYYCDSKQNKQE